MAAGPRVPGDALGVRVHECLAPLEVSGSATIEKQIEMKHSPCHRVRDRESQLHSCLTEPLRLSSALVHGTQLAARFTVTRRETCRACTVLYVCTVICVNSVNTYNCNHSNTLSGVQEASKVHGAAATELIGGGRRDAGRRGATAGLQRLPREEGFEDFLGAPVLLHETWMLKRGGMGDLGGG